MSHDGVEDPQHPYFFLKPENKGFWILTVVTVLEIIQCGEVKGRHFISVDVLGQGLSLTLKNPCLSPTSSANLLSMPS
jgi:hypothetical protein